MPFCFIDMAVGGFELVPMGVPIILVRAGIVIYVFGMADDRNLYADAAGTSGSQSTLGLGGVYGIHARLCDGIFSGPGGHFSQ